MAEESYRKNWLTPKNILLYVVIGAVAYALIYYFFLANKTSSPYMVTTGNVKKEQTGESMSMSVVLNLLNDSEQSGQATLTEVGGKTTVTLRIQNEPGDASQPAHIHKGVCPNPGAVTYPLSNVVNGMSETVLDVGLATLKAQLPLAVNVHKSAAEISSYVACGDVQ